MSDDFLYHGLGVWGYRVSGLRFHGGRCVMEMEATTIRLGCSLCGSRAVIRRGNVPREFLAPPIGRQVIVLRYAVPRLECRACGAVRQVRLSFADEHRRFTRSFERFVLELSRHMTIQSVARHLSIGWHVVKDIQKRYLRRRFRRIPLRKLKRIAIDEIAERKGRKYLTVVLDLDTGAVVFVGDGKGADALAPFWARLKRAGARIKAVATDLAPAYWASAMTHLPGAAIVFDRFHVVKLFNEKLSELRRKLAREADAMGRQMLKGVRWLLMKNPENLNPTRQEARRLEDALKFNEPLARAYYLKEQLRLFWEQQDKKAAARFLDQWVRWADGSDVKTLKDMARTLAYHRFGLLAWYDHPISTAALEGTNNKIKTLKRQAYGFRDREFFKLKILALHESRYEMVG
ncbi:ISL3 family transposase [bacterium]|nr:ISL3 family transposase [bacterium]